jgi:hypothetical protein
VNKEIKNSKKKLLNHPKIMEYLFNKPIIKTTNLKMALDFVKGYYIKDVRVDKIMISEIECLFLEICHYMNQYYYIYRKYREHISKYIRHNNSKIYLDRQLPLVPNIYPKQIVKTLQRLKINYITQWTFKNEEEHTNAREIEPYYFEINLEVDFYCCLFFKKRMILFAINCLPANTTISYLKWYYLCQMNIHLLVVLPNEYNSSPNTIREFIEKISESDLPIIMGTNPITNVSCDIRLNIFYDNYMRNHIIYVKHYDNHSENEKTSKIYNYIENPDDISYVVPSELNNFISDSTIFFTNK